MRLVGPSGLEPPTSCLSGTRSNHLSYEPVFSTSCSEEWKMKSEELLLKFELVQISSFSLLTSFSAWFAVVEMMGFEPMTPCLQGRCSPSWATPPSLYGNLLSPKDPSKLNNESNSNVPQRNRLLLSHTSFMHGRFSIERRWSSRTFRYGYLVTT